MSDQGRTVKNFAKRLRWGTMLAASLVALTGGAVAYADNSGGDSFSDVPKDHWSYQALDYLAKNGIIEGYPNGTFQGNRTMTRYEMAAIVAKAMQKQGLDIGSEAVLEKLEAEYGSELSTLRAQVQKNTEDIKKNREDIDRVKLYGFLRTQYDYDKDTTHHTQDKQTDRFYMNLYADFKVNDHWTVKAQSETNRHYNNGHQRLENARNDYGYQTWSGHDGNFQRIWVEGHKDNNWISIGRAWRGLGYQNVLFGNESDGLQFGVPLKGTGLTASGFWMASTGAGNKESLYGVGFWGPVGHSTGINIAYAKSSLDKGETYSSDNIVGYHTDMRPTLSDGSVNPDYGKVFPDRGVNDVTNPRSYGFVLSGYIDALPNVRLLGDYVQTDADFQNKSLALRINYKGTDIKKPGSFGTYLRYIKYGQNGWLAGDDEWNSTWNGTKGWIFGVKYVPWENVEWETLFSRQKRNYDTHDEYDRTLIRTQVDYHF